ncbi:MAG: hypothetical protein ACTSVY_07780 [Candidatus Helarchaeota archaeon]
MSNLFKDPIISINTSRTNTTMIAHVVPFYFSWKKLDMSNTKLKENSNLQYNNGS